MGQLVAILKQACCRPVGAACPRCRRNIHDCRKLAGYRLTDAFYLRKPLGKGGQGVVYRYGRHVNGILKVYIARSGRYVLISSQTRRVSHDLNSIYD